MKGKISGENNLNVYLVIFFIVIIYVVLFIAPRYDINSVHPEYVSHIAQHVENGNDLKLNDVLQAFNWRNFETGERWRYLSYFFQIVNCKFRLALFEYIPPHPSVSLSWVFVYFLSPLFFYKFLKNLTGDKRCAVAGTSILFLSPGLLSGATMLFHPGKPISFFFAVFCLYLASRISVEIKRGHQLARRIPLLYASLFLSTFIAYFADENAWFILVCVPLFFWEIFFVRAFFSSVGINEKLRKGIPFAAFLGTFIVYLYVVIVLAPKILQTLRYDSSGTIWNDSGRSGGANPLFMILERLNVENLFFNSHTTFAAHVVPILGEYKLHSTDFYSVSLSFFMYLILGGMSIYFLCKAKKEEKILFLRSMSVIVMFFLFTAILHSAHMPTSHTGFYYSGFFSIFFSVFMSLLITNDIFNKKIQVLLLAVFLIILGSNFLKVNHGWNYGHTSLYKHFFSEHVWSMQEEKTLTYAMVKAIWKNKENSEMQKKLKKEFPVRAYWLFEEIQYVPGAVGYLTEENKMKEKLFSEITKDLKGMILLKRDDGRLFYVNDELCDALGYGRKELMRKNIADITMNDESGAAQLVRKDGGKFFVNVSHKSLLIDQRNHILMILHKKESFGNMDGAEEKFEKSLLKPLK